MRVGHRRVLVDYAHNDAAVGGLVDFALQLDAGRRVGVVTGPGDRRDEDLREIGRLTAPFDHVIVKEDHDRRGRREGEIAELVIAGLVERGHPREAIEIVPDEAAAVERAVALLGDRDLAVVLADDVAGVLRLVRGMGGA